jgi:hypothetical protein
MKINLKCHLAGLTDETSAELSATLCQKLSAINLESTEAHIQYRHNGHFPFGIAVYRTFSKIKYTAVGVNMLIARCYIWMGYNLSFISSLNGNTTNKLGKVRRA